MLYKAETHQQSRLLWEGGGGGGGGTVGWKCRMGEGVRLTQGREGEKMEWKDDIGRGGIKLYKTHLPLSTMEKVKAHDRYKRICYFVHFSLTLLNQLFIYTGRFIRFNVCLGTFRHRCSALSSVGVQWAVRTQKQEPNCY